MMELGVLKPAPPNLPILVASSPDIDYPFSTIPPHLTSCGPIIRAAPPIGEADAGLAEWLSQGPTIYVNLGTHHKSKPTEAHEMSKAFRKVLEHADTLHSAGKPLQVLWKLGRVPDEKGNAPKGDSYTGKWALVTDELQAYIKQGRVRIMDWLVAEPKSVLESRSIICSVSHGGANSFYEALCSSIPQALLPAWTDCYDFANHVELLGIGRWANKEAKPRWKEDELARALLEILFGPESAGMRMRAEEIASRHPEWEGRQMAAQEILNYLTRMETSFSNFQRDIYQSFRPPLFSTNPTEWESLAKEKIPATNFGYVYGSASSAATAKANSEAFSRYRLKPRFLVDVTRRDVDVELFGTKYKSPLIVAPIGVQSILHPDAEEATARACHNVGMPMILSTAATRTIEEVATANADGDRWYQLYWPKPQFEEVTASLLARAKASGYKVLVVTLDTFSLGWRPTDLDTSYLPFIWGQGCQIGFSDPVFNKLFDGMQKNDSRSIAEKLAELWTIMRRPGTVYGAARVLANAKTLIKSKAWIDVINSGTYRSWNDLKILKDLWDGPVVLKGIQTVENAHLAIEHGIDGIIVSNHGGRQLDGAIASLDALADIAADKKVKDSNLTIMFDSGVRTGSDVLKALALGAKAVCIGRPYAYGLAAGGKEGVEHVLKCLLADMDNMLANAGKKSVWDLSRDDLQILPLSKI
ncbi:hypothetical protein H9Q74_011965 [Fusarium xylarioides]|nr:hypothetical protein H9Q71_011855 [Fusarium xylarioides]KAG5814962.1 hypothetical protein H9Q74_011965 [Fusarium xylarioides]